jgi:hypothetical protein
MSVESSRTDGQLEETNNVAWTEVSMSDANDFRKLEKQFGKEMHGVLEFLYDDMDHKKDRFPDFDEHAADRPLILKVGGKPAGYMTMNITPTSDGKATMQSRVLFIAREMRTHRHIIPALIRKIGEIAEQKNLQEIKGSIANPELLTLIERVGGTRVDEFGFIMSLPVLQNLVRRLS